MKKAFAQIPLLIAFILMAVALPVASKLVQQNQTNEGRAALAEPCKVCVGKICKTVASGSMCMSSENECNTNANCGGVVATTRPTATPAGNRPTATPTRRPNATATPAGNRPTATPTRRPNATATPASSRPTPTSFCAREGLYYGCNNPPYTDENSCVSIAISNLKSKGAINVSKKCCSPNTAGHNWDCYFNGSLPTPTPTSFCAREGLYYGCNNPPYTDENSCVSIAISNLKSKGAINVSKKCCSPNTAGHNWDCYFNGSLPTPTPTSFCAREGLYYGCNNPPYTDENSCVSIAISNLKSKGAINVSKKCCSPNTAGHNWDCYFNGSLPTPTVKICRGDVDYNGDGVINSLDMIRCSLGP